MSREVHVRFCEGLGVRFPRATRLVILTRDPEEAAEAKAATEQALARLRLELNDDETAIRSIDDGFSYLGYLFVRSLVLEQRRGASEGGAGEGSDTLPTDLEPADVPSGSWLAGVPLDRIEELLERRRGRSRGRTAARYERVPLARSRSLRGLRWPLYVVTPDTRLYLRRGTVVVEAGAKTAEEPAELPLSGLSHVVFWGRARATLPVLRSLAREGVASYFCRADGELESVFGPHEPDWRLWLEQARAAADGELCLRFGAAIVEARLRNLATQAVRFGWGEGGEPAAELRRLAGEAVNKTTPEALRGLEGRGAALVFGALGEALPAGWGFEGRERRPPPDPVNAMLSFGYSLLHNHSATALIEAGLSPRIGLFHHPRGAHLALASDLMEEVRHLVESVVWTVIRRRQIQPEDFRASADGAYPALLRRSARKTFLDAFERRLMTELTPEGEEEPLSYRAFLFRQARQIRDLVEGRAAGYAPLLVRA
ncbi:MAG: CRISPR-associated endonuclease Cas1 [Holophagales bacterium]|nr:CRISPR-associated endonuclease Cas1 [Holophagales bacterium]